MTKKVSVVMCTYNGEKYLREQIDSILGQTYPIYELIIQDDCSTDNTCLILKEYQCDNRVKVYVNESRLGFNTNFNTALSRVGGDYVALSDQDDVWRKDKIEILVKNIGNYALLFHDSFLFTDDDITHPIGRKNGVNVNLHEVYMLMKPYIPGHECFFRKEILPKFLELTMFEPSVSFDSLICLVGSVYGGVKYINEGLTYWRRHSMATSYSGAIIPRRGFRGILKAIQALADKKKRKNTQRYFQLVESLDYKSKVAILLVKYMKKGNIWGILWACFVCLNNRSLFYQQRLFTKVFFIPLYFNRDYSSYILK